MQKFKPVITDQLFLLPPSIEDFVPAGHLARVVNDIVDTIDVSAIENKYSMLGQKSYHPHLVLKLLFYGYCTGVRSGRKIAAACQQDTAFMFLACMYKPDFRTINDFFAAVGVPLFRRCCYSLILRPAGITKYQTISKYFSLLLLFTNSPKNSFTTIRRCRLVFLPTRLTLRVFPYLIQFH